MTSRRTSRSSLAAANARCGYNREVKCVRKAKDPRVTHRAGNPWQVIGPSFFENKIPKVFKPTPYRLF